MLCVNSTGPRDAKTHYSGCVCEGILDKISILIGGVKHMPVKVEQKGLPSPV